MMIEGRHRPDTRLTRWRAARAATALSLLYASSVFGATLSTTHSTTSDGLIAVTILVKPGDGESVAGAQFNVRIDPGLYQVHKVVAGDAAANAGKDVAVGAHGDALTVLVAGFNQFAMSEGALATIYLASLGNPSGILPSIDAAVLSDPFGKQVPASIPPEPKTVEPPVDEAAPPESDSSSPAPATESPVPATTGELDSRASARTGYGGLADSENAVSVAPILSPPPPFSTGRHVSASPLTRAPLGTGQPSPGIPASMADGVAAGVPMPESTAGPEETASGSLPARRESARQVKLAHAMTPLTSGERGAAGSSVPSSPGEGAGNTSSIVLQSNWRKPVLFVLSLVVIASAFPLRRRLFGKGRS